MQSKSFGEWYEEQKREPVTLGYYFDLDINNYALILVEFYMGRRAE